MPLELLLALVIGGIGAIALLLHLTGHSARLDLSDRAVVAAHWARLFPDDDPPLAILTDAEGRAALAETAAGPVLLWAMGADCTAHDLVGARARPTAQGLAIALPDFGAPGLRVRLGTAQRARWQAAIGRAAATGEARA